MYEIDINYEQADIIISGMSSICLEAMALGIPAIIVENIHGLKYNAIPSQISKDLWKKLFRIC